MAPGLLSVPAGISMGSKGTESKLDYWMDRALWALLCGVCLFASNKISELSNNIVDLRLALNANTAAVASAKEELTDHESRIRALEQARRSPARSR